MNLQGNFIKKDCKVKKILKFLILFFVLLGLSFCYSYYAYKKDIIKKHEAMYDKYDKVKYLENKIDYKNATEHEKINFYIKDFLQKIHYLDNYPAKDLNKMKSIHRDIADYEQTRFGLCHGDKYPDDKCEFFKLDNRLNLEYLLNLGGQICNSDTPIDNAQDIIDNDEVLKIEPFYPFNQQFVIDENGKFIDNFIYVREDIIALYSDFIFTNKEILKYHDTQDDIVIATDSMYAWFLEDIFDTKNIKNFCYKHNLIMTNKKKFFEKIHGREYYFKYIPRNQPTLGNIVFNDFSYNGDYYYNAILEQYQTLKNKNFNKNLNLKGDGNAKN